MVLFGHLFMANGDPVASLPIRVLAQVRAAGWVGVDLFFVLSGFLITGILYDTLPDQHFFRNFYARRVLRIFPLYYGVVLVGMVVAVLSHQRWTAEMLRVLTYTQNLHLKVAGPTQTGWVVIGHFWSLAVEEQFYLVWPLAVFLLRTRGRIAAVAIAGAALSMGLRFYFEHLGLAVANPATMFSFTPARVDGLLLGAVLAMGVRGRNKAAVLRFAPWVLGVCATVIATLTVKEHRLSWMDTPTTTWGFSVLDLGFAALLATTLRPRGVGKVVFAWAPLRFFGRYSYGLYVYHLTVALLLERVLTRDAMLRATGSKFLAVLTPGTLALMVTIGVAWVSFQFYESRFLKLKDRFHDNTRRKKLHDFVAEA